MLFFKPYMGISKMKKEKVSILIYILFLILLISILSGCFDTSEKDEAHDFVFTALDGSEKHLSDYRGKVVILDMWATWCGPCQFQMTELIKVYENYSKADLEIISVDIDPRETSQQIQSFKLEFEQEVGTELNWVFGIDDGSIWEKYKLENGGIPTLYIFDQKGNIHFSEEGLAVFSEIPEWWPETQPLPTKLAPKIEELL